MNYRSLILWGVCCTMMMFGCKQKSDSTLETIEVNFHNNEGKSISEIANDFYSDKRYVVLHSDDSNMMLGTISTIVLHNDKIFVVDSRTRNFVVHDKNGQAVAKIGHRGRGPGEYISPSSFDIDKQGRIHLIDGNTAKLLIYDKDYQFIEAKNLPFNVEIMKCMPDGGYLFGLSFGDKSRYEGTRIIRTTQDLEVINETGKYDKELTDGNVWFSPYFFIEAPDGIFYHKSVDENVYQLDENGEITKRYFFDLGDDAIPVKLRKNLEPAIESDEIAAYRALLNFAAPYGRYIYGLMYDKGTTKSYIYDTNNSVAYMIDREDAINFGYILSINNGFLITFFPYNDSGNLPDDLPEEMRQQVLDGDLLICLYKLD